MQPVQSISASIVAELIRRQPASKEKTAFAWQLAVGAALARVTSVELRGRVLVVRAADPRWIAEIERARAVIRSRMQHLLDDPQIDLDTRVNP